MDPAKKKLRKQSQACKQNSLESVEIGFYNLNLQFKSSISVRFRIFSHHDHAFGGAQGCDGPVHRDIVEKIAAGVAWSSKY